MSEYRVQLEAYAGPLDLLLHLVKRNEIDLHDIPIAQLTDQYMEHLRVIRTIDVEKAGQFLVMAATLLEIKSRMIAPAPEQEQEEGEQAGEDAAQDPRYELVQQLLAYKRFKDAARQLEQQQQEWEQRYTVQGIVAGEREDDAQAAERMLELDDVNVLDLCQAFGRLLDSVGQRRDHEVTIDETPIELHAADIHDRLKEEGPLTLEQLAAGRDRPGELVGMFLATLELVRQRKVRVKQGAVDEPIRLEPVEEGEAGNQAGEEAAADWRDPQTGEVEYDWPDERSRQRAAKRAELRAAKARGEAVGEAVGDDEEDVDDDRVAGGSSE